MAGPVSLVGREDELSALLGALGGDARLVLVVGDAGVGKTRFVTEGMERAAAAGMVMIRGECLPLSGTLPLLPVADALGELARLADGRVLAEALDAAPGYVRQEVRRLLPGLDGGGSVPDGRGGEWSQQRLFAGVAELLAEVADRAASGAGLVVEDVHWADSATLDCLTVLFRAGRRSGLRLVVTCRGDEAPLAGHVADWLAQVRADAGVQEIRLGPLSRDQAARQVAALAGGPAPAQVVDELYARAEGNPFFTEQLVAAALAAGGGTGGGGGLLVPTGLPARLAELLAARAARCAGDARAVLAGLAVAGRPLREDVLGQVTGLEAEVVRRGLRELAAARLLADDTAGGGYRPRHALLGEAVAAGLLPGERAMLHERAARAVAAAADPAQAAEVAGHWQAAGRPAEELPARLAAAEAAEQVFGYAQAAEHWQRAIDLAQPDAAGVDLPRLYARAADALHLSGGSERAARLAEEAYRRYASHPDPATAAVALHRAAYFRALGGHTDVLPLIEQAVRLFEQAPPSFDHARALHDAGYFLMAGEGRPEAGLPVLNRALEIAEAVGATALIPRILASIGKGAVWRGQIEEGLATLARGWALARAVQDGPALVVLAVAESDVLLKLARFQRAAEAAARGLDAARQAGLQSWELPGFLAANAAEALLALGHTERAAALIDPLTAGPPEGDHWFAHALRAEIDLLRGEAGAAAARLRLIVAFPVVVGRVEYASEAGRRAAEAALWTGRPGDALDEVRQVLAQVTSPDVTIFCGRLLAAGMMACADLAGRARARRDEPGIGAAVAAADSLASWVAQMGGVPFADHPYLAAIPAERATWDAEWTRLDGPGHPDTWAGVAKAWQDLDCPHRAAYAWWRQAQAQLDAGQPAAAAAAALRAAADAADGHAPLQAQINTLADRARITLPPRAAAGPAAPPPATVPARYGLTSRELAVLRLLAAGRTNAQIGTELYISPKTAGAHVSSILRKLGVSGRVQAAAIAERAGLLRSGQP
jgi:DNA-binding CsgD family transcriptional regulator/tetratricopeptide (TPR) repeat protein